MGTLGGKGLRAGTAKFSPMWRQFCFFICKAKTDDDNHKKTV